MVDNMSWKFKIAAAGALVLWPQLAGAWEVKNEATTMLVEQFIESGPLEMASVYCDDANGIVVNLFSSSRLTTANIFFGGEYLSDPMKGDLFDVPGYHVIGLTGKAARYFVRSLVETARDARRHGSMSSGSEIWLSDVGPIQNLNATDFDMISKATLARCYIF